MYRVNREPKDITLNEGRKRGGELGVLKAREAGNIPRGRVALSALKVTDLKRTFTAIQPTVTFLSLLAR